MPPSLRPEPKNTDSRGRVTLGKAFADRTVLVQHVSETEVRIILARVIPENEMWLWKNPEALASVLQGIEDARAGNLVDGPSLEELLADAGDLDEDE
jgi:hypothetical protein